MVELDMECVQEVTKSQQESNLCRLCLNLDEFVVDIFEEQLDENLKKPSLAQRLFDLFQIKYEKTSTLPSRICQRCLYMVEAFTSFRKNVQTCELELQKRSMAVQKSQGNVFEDNCRSGLNGCPGLFEPEKDCIITVVDPNQEYESSDDDFSMESESEVEDHSINLQKSFSLGTLTASEQTVKRVSNTNKNSERPVENRNKDSSFSAPALETLAMEFTKNTFLCQYCDMAFTTHMDCAEHESRHDPSNPFTCNFCPFRTSNRQNLIYHIKEMHENERPYICALCNKGFCRRSDLKKHTIVHTGVRPFTCPVCAKSFSRNTNLTKHMRIHSGIKPHVCQKCPRSFTTAGELMRHSRSHSELKPFQCGKCSASFTRKDKLQLHEQSHFRKQSEFLSNQSKSTSNQDVQNSKSKNIGSLNPYKDGDNRSSYALHSLDAASSGVKAQKFTAQLHKSSSEDAYKHSILATQLQQSHPLGGETMNLQSENKFKVMPKPNPRCITCDICSKVFTRERDYQRHQALHMDKLFTCKQCGRGFNRREKLVRHEQEHHPSQSFTCDKCHITFTKRDALNMHLKVHDLQHNMSIQHAVTSGSSVESSSVGDLLHKRLTQQSTSATEMSFYNQIAPTMNLGFYSETRPEDRNGV